MANNAGLVENGNTPLCWFLHNRCHRLGAAGGLQPGERQVRFHEESPNARNHKPERVSERVGCGCHADYRVSTTRSGRCQRQLEALASGRVPLPIIEEIEVNAKDEKLRTGKTAQYDWQNQSGYAMHTSIRILGVLI
ncbi:hypothetical protein ACVWZW_006897 [Bradyrhizobium sp. F1.13.4]